MKIYQVMSVVVVKQSDAPLTLSITAFGLTASSGWANPRLDAGADPNPGDAVLEFAFEADRPGGISLPALTPTIASVVVQPKNGADAVIVSARTNSLTVHASEFQTQAHLGATVPLLNPPTTTPIAEEARPTTLAIGEEGIPTTLRYGEEGIPTTWRIGEEGTTYRWGEEGGTTFRWGEEGGGGTDPRIDDPPFGPGLGGDPIDPLGGGGGGFDPGGGGPFGGY